VVKFKYFEQHSTNKNFIQDEMKSRLRPRNPARTLLFFLYYAYPLGIRTSEEHSITKNNLKGGKNPGEIISCYGAVQNL